MRNDLAPPLISGELGERERVAGEWGHDPAFLKRVRAERLTRNWLMVAAVSAFCLLVFLGLSAVGL
jgi:hypothetical protein